MNRRKRTRLRKSALPAAACLVLSLVICVSAVKIIRLLTSDDRQQKTVSNNINADYVTAATEPQLISTEPATEAPTEPEAEKPPENLTLVNRNHALPDSFSVDLVQLSNGRSVSSEIYPDLQKMFDDMRADGIYPVVSEGFRTCEEQRQMMDEKTAAYENEGYSHADAVYMAEQYVALPGTSEHELGLAVDINADEELSADWDVYQWLADNAHLYGFILRYPSDKTDITGIDYEPWHYRWVGEEAAAEIHSQGLCLEEYTDSVS